MCRPFSQAFLPGRVHHVERDHHRPAQIAQLEREFQVAFEAGRIDDLNDQVRRCERRGRTARLVHRDRRALVAPQQIFQRGQIVLRQVMQRLDARQIDHARLVQTDLHDALAVGAVRAGQLTGMRCSARYRAEERALAGFRHPHQRDAQAPLATEQGRVQRDGGFDYRHLQCTASSMNRLKNPTFNKLVARHYT